MIVVERADDSHRHFGRAPRSLGSTNRKIGVPFQFSTVHWCDHKLGGLPDSVILKIVPKTALVPLKMRLVN